MHRVPLPLVSQVDLARPGPHRVTCSWEAIVGTKAIQLPDSAESIDLAGTTLARCRWCGALTMPRDAMRHYKWHRHAARQLHAARHPELHTQSYDSPGVYYDMAREAARTLPPPRPGLASGPRGAAPGPTEDD